MKHDFADKVDDPDFDQRKKTAAQLHKPRSKEPRALIKDMKNRMGHCVSEITAKVCEDLGDSSLTLDLIEGSSGVDRGDNWKVKGNHDERNSFAHTEAAQVHTNKHAVHSECAAAAAAANAAFVAIPRVMNGRTFLHESEDMQQGWAHQENFAVKAGVEDAKTYRGARYE
ncbi:hypothetical protein BGZ63DRAFT_427163 [Mariannaea sp. PMI_226]|nr:hypothetical protein BGZ63DRAFT_427163 [Mariannaea sp. PMI_226]